MSVAQFSSEIAAAAAKSGVAADLIAAVVQIESGGNPWAFRPEPRYRYVVDVRTREPFRKLTAAEAAAKNPPTDFPYLAGSRTQEWWGQQTSWGLMQVMGAVAREEGFSGPFLSELTSPALNLEIGSRVLFKLLLWADGDICKAAAAYNGGRGGWTADAPARYAEKVLRALSQSAFRG